MEQAYSEHIWLGKRSKAAKLIVMMTMFTVQRLFVLLQQSLSYDPIFWSFKNDKKPYLLLAIRKINGRFETRLYSTVVYLYS